MTEAALFYPSEPAVSWDFDELKKLMIWATKEMDASDVNLYPGDVVWIRRHGIWYRVTRRPLTVVEVASLLDQMTSSSASSARILGAEYHDFATEVKVMRGEKINFRINATGCKVGSGIGINIVMRSIPGIPPDLDDLDIEPELLQAAFPPNGLVLVTGVMGSGKSTLIAAILRRIAETQRRFIITYEAPVEFDLVGIPGRIAPVVQCTVGERDISEDKGGYGFENIPSFDQAPRNSTRRAADVVLLGEARDEATVDSMIEVAEIGLAVYSTVHTRSVPETLTRIVNIFPGSQQNRVAVTLLSALRLIVHQRLVPKKGGGRVALREFYAFNDESVRETMLSDPDMTKVVPFLRREVAENGQTLLTDARRKHEKDLIDDNVLEGIEREFARRTNKVKEAA